MFFRKIEQFLQYAEETGVISPNTTVGCTESEIAAIETKYNIAIPHAYRSYLSTMGHHSGRLFSHDHMIVSYQFILDATAEVPDELQREYPDEYPTIVHALPKDALIIASRLAENYWFIVCNHEQDSPVYHFHDTGAEYTQVEESFVEWLYWWVLEAVRAIESGYYER